MTRILVIILTTIYGFAAFSSESAEDVGNREQYTRACIEGRSSDGQRIDLDQRIKACTNLSTFEASEFAGIYFRARLKHQSGDWKGAEQDFTTALSLNPNTPAAHYDRGRIRLKHLARPDAAVADFSEAIWLTRSKPRAYYFLARADAYSSLAGADGPQKDIDRDMLRRARSDIQAYLVMTAEKPRVKDYKKRDVAREVLEWMDNILKDG